MEEVAISVKGVSKDFVLPHEKADSIKSIFVNPFNKNRRNYETQHALDNISFDVKKGEFFGIVGRNGSGKSTLLKIIAGIYQPTKGTISIDGRLVPFIELGVGFNPELTGRENVYLNGALLGFSEREVDEKYKSIVDFAELERFMDQKLKNYSSGMQVRLAFSVATMLAESDVLLIDEVLAVGDADFQKKCFEYFKKLKKQRKAVIFVTHDMSAVREYCDRAILIDNSKLVFSGNSEQAAQEYTKIFFRSLEEEQKLEGRQSETVSKWGEGGVDISGITVSRGSFSVEDENITICYKVTANDKFIDIVNPGFVIKNEQGQAVCGTNTVIADYSKRIDLTDKNRAFEVRWLIPNIFNEGKYTVDAAVLSCSNGSTLQWWIDAISFRVINDKSTPYLISPKTTVEIKSVK